jgi:hypothetical protein
VEERLSGEEAVLGTVPGDIKRWQRVMYWARAAAGADGGVTGSGGGRETAWWRSDSSERRRRQRRGGGGCLHTGSRSEPH